MASKHGLGPRVIDGFDLNTPYDTPTQKMRWREFLRTLDPQRACRLCGIDHIPHWLAGAANWRYLLEFLRARYPGDSPVADALVAALKLRRPDPKSEESDWWQAMAPVVPELERFAFLYSRGLIKPFSEALLEGMTDSTGTWHAPEREVA